MKKAICTVITKSYISFARTLFESIKRFHKNIDFFVLLIDPDNQYFDSKNDEFTIVSLAELDERDVVFKMAFYYTAFELCNALKPFIISHLIDRGYQRCIFLDSDTYLFNNLDEEFNLLEEYSMLLTPHFLPENKNITPKLELDILKSGIYNAGFIAVSGSNEAKEFLKWFKSRLSIYSFFDLGVNGKPKRGLNADQLWLNIVPLLFKNIFISQNPGLNKGHWNINNYSVKYENQESIIINGTDKLVLYHYSGLDVYNPNCLSKFLDKKLIMESETENALKKINKSIAESILRNGYNESIKWPYSYNYFDKNKKQIKIWMRAFYYTYRLKIGSPPQSIKEFYSIIPRIQFNQMRIFCSKANNKIRKYIQKS